MKKKTISIFCTVFLLFTSNQIFGQFSAEINSDGSASLFFSNGVVINNYTNGTWNSTLTGCVTCMQTLPGVTVIGVRPTSTTVVYTSYTYQGQYYEMPTNPTVPPVYYSLSVSNIVNTNPPQAVILPPVITPCTGKSIGATAAAGYGNANNINNPAFVNNLLMLTATLSTDTKERSLFLGISGTTGSPSISQPVLGNTGNTGPASPPAGMTPLAFVHTHTSNFYPTPSRGDIYQLISVNQQNPSLQFSYIIHEDGTRYVLMVTDAAKAATFVSNFPEAANTNGSGWTGSSANGPQQLHNDVYNQLNPSVTSGTTASDQLAELMGQAYVLDKLNTGLTLLKDDGNGRYSEVHVVGTTDAAGNTTYSKFNCL